MFTPARKARGPVPCTRLPRLLSVATTGAVFIGAGLGVMPASAHAQSADEQSVIVDVVGDSYMAGDGLQDTYLDPADPRHRSAIAPALQALARVRSDNSRMRVDANLVAASGARTADFFFAQAGQDNSVVNPPQRDQVRPDSQMVIVGFGGDDVRLAEVLANARRTTGGPNTVLDKEIRALGPLLDWTASDEEYLEQAKSSPPGQAPTLVARMLQVLAGVAARAPHAEIVVTTYPLAADPQDAHATSLVGEDELTTVRKFGYDLNKAIDRAVRICSCGSLADLAEAVAGHEIYTSDSVFNEQGDQREPFLPNGKGASLIADPIADSIAKVLRIPPPKRGDGQVTTAENIYVRYGVSDRDGDAVEDVQDRAPDDATRSTDVVRLDRDRRSSHQDSRSGQSDDAQRLPGVLHPVVQVVDGLAPGVSLIGPHDRPPADEKNRVVVGSRPPGREQAIPAESTALALEPAAAPPVPGEDSPSSWSPAERAAAEDVVDKAMPAGYVSMYSTRALRVAAVPADVRTVSDKAAVDRQMSQSFLSGQAGFRARFGENIDAIHHATTVSGQDAAIARFNQTAAEYNATELAARDVHGAHPADARGQTVRVTPTSLGDLAAGTIGPAAANTLAVDSAEAQAVAYGPVDAAPMAAVSDQAPARTVTVAEVAGETTLSAQTDVSTLAAAGSPKAAPAKSSVSVESKPDFSVSANGSLFGPGEVSRSAERDGVTVTGKAEGRALGLEGTVTGDVSPEGMNGKISGRGVLGEGTVGMTAKSENGETGYVGKGNLGAEIGVGGKLNGINDFGLNANGKIGGTASVQDSGNYGLVEGSRKAELGVGADFDATARVSPDGLKIGSHASLGAKAKAETKVGVPGLSLDFTGTAFAGPGYDYGIRFGKQEDGKYRFGFTAGFSPVVGVAGGFDISVDPDKLQQSVREAVDALNPFGPDQMDSPRSLAQDDPAYDGPTDSPAESQMDSPRSLAQDDPGYDGVADSAADALGESQMDSPRSQAQDDPGYDGPTDSVSDAAISGTTDPASDTIAGYSATDTFGGETDSDTLGGATDAGYSDSGYSDSDAGDTSDTSGGYGDGDAGAPGSGTSDGGTDSGFSGGGGDFGGGGATGDFGGSDSFGGGSTGDSGDSGMGGDSGGLGGDSSGVGGDSSSGVGGDSGGMGGDSSGGSDGGGDGGGDGGSSSGGTGGGGMSSGGTGMGSGGMGGGPGGGDGGGF